MGAGSTNPGVFDALNASVFTDRLFGFLICDLFYVAFFCSEISKGKKAI
jgi:hypothetical protein